MRIGILTYHYPENRNYGALLQLYALYSTLERMGHIPYVIRYKFGSISYQGFKGFIINILIYILETRVFISFSKKYLKNKTIPVTHANAHHLNDCLDTFIVGSDQVWRAKYVPNIKDFFFQFVNENKKKISYAASFGSDTWNEVSQEVTEEIKLLLTRFSAVSVREQSGIEICKKLGCNNAEIVLDPVFLLSQSDYLKLIKRKHAKQKTISYFLLDSISLTTFNTIQSFSKSQKATLINLKGKQLPIIPQGIPLKYSFSQWLFYIQNSELIITDSFHCVAFCLIFKKQFICIPNINRGFTRLESLLKILDLQDRISPELNVNSLNYAHNNPIDYLKVNSILEPLKEKSINFLKQNLQ
ncbi:MAG: polysaccharide pyruvyl transferase family protein [Bacteroidales bacterium]